MSYSEYVASEAASPFKREYVREQVFALHDIERASQA
jgi:hypothetical protein